MRPTLSLTCLALALAACAPPSRPAPAAPFGEPTASEAASDSLRPASGVAYGSADAPLTLYQFTDYQCPDCAAVALGLVPAIKREFVESGRVRLVYLDFPLPQHRHALLAARAARCAHDAGAHEPFTRALYERQREWAPSTQPADLFVSYGAAAGIDTAAFGTCLRSDRHTQAVQENERLARRIRVPGTPTFYLGERMIPWDSTDALPEILRRGFAR